MAAAAPSNTVVQESAPAETNLAVMSSHTGRDSVENPQQTSASDSAISDSVQASFPTDSWDQALKTGDTVTCVRLARDAGHLRQADAVPALAALFAPTRGCRSHWRKRSVEWIEVRTTAVEALSRVQDAPQTPERPKQSATAVDALVEALFDPVEQVRIAAHQRLLWHGEEAASSLKRCLSTSRNWSLAGMRGVIETLGALKCLESGPTVARVLLGGLPLAPVHWSTATMLKRSLVTGLTIGGLAEITMLGIWGTRPITFGMLPVIILCYVLFTAFIFIVTLILVFTPLSSLRETADRADLVASAARALASIRDPRALPCVIEATLGANRWRQGEARKTLLALLALLDAQAYGLLPAESLQLLYAALGNALLSQALTLAIVRSLEWVGTGQAVAPVQRLVKRGANAEIRNEAERLLPCLLWRQQRETEPTFLLRASGRPEIGADQLLRPTAAATENYPDQLLRPSGGN